MHSTAPAVSPETNFGASNATASLNARWSPVGWWCALILFVLVAGWLRTHDLARRPMHADEANQAVKTGVLLEHGDYRFDPHDHHGPTLYYGALPIAWLRGQHTLGELDEVSVRLVPAVAGVVAVGLLAWLAWPLGRWPALAAAAFLAVSPPAVYYSRYFIQETLLVAFTLGAFLAVGCWWKSGRTCAIVMAGGLIGLMLATKASAPLFLGAAVVSVGVVQLSLFRKPSLWRAIGLAGIIAIGVSALFYTSFGKNLAGLRDAVASYGVIGARVSGETGHEKPWWYYLSLFGWIKNGGLTWHQLAFSALALFGVISAIVTKNRWLIGVAIYTGIVMVGLSLMAYKTPWHVVHVVPGMVVLAAGALGHLRSRIVAGTVFVVVGATLLQQTWRAVFLRPADARNPYAYVHSVPDVLKYRAVVDAALRDSPDGIVRVIGEEYWPLPWYLRGVDKVGYWSVAPDECDGAIVIATAVQADAVRAKLRGVYRESFLGLRLGVICVIFTREP